MYGANRDRDRYRALAQLIVLSNSGNFFRNSAIDIPGPLLFFDCRAASKMWPLARLGAELSMNGG